MTLRFEPRDSAFENLEDVYDGELYLGWLARARHGKKRDWWFVQPVGDHCKTMTGREAALKFLQKARAAR